MKELKRRGEEEGLRKCCHVGVMCSGEVKGIRSSMEDWSLVKRARWLVQKFLRGERIRSLLAWERTGQQTWGWQKGQVALEEYRKKNETFWGPAGSGR